MNIVEPKHLLLQQEGGSIASMMKFITKIGYTCYKTNKEITDKSAAAFVEGLISRGHLSVLEHGTVFLAIPAKSIRPKSEVSNNVNLLLSKQQWTRYTEKVMNDTLYLMIVTNYRVIHENNLQHFMKTYWYIPTPEERLCRPTVLYTSNIHFYKDATRHRMFSWCIESTRYCNYTLDRFSNSVAFMKPSWLKEEHIEEFNESCKQLEEMYFKWINLGYSAQHAAYFLCQGTKADVVMTGFNDDWEHFFDLRALAKTGEPHPDVKLLALNVYNEFLDKKIIEPDTKTISKTIVS